MGKLHFLHVGVVLDTDNSSRGARHIDDFGGAFPTRSVLVVRGSINVDLFTDLEIQPLGWESRPGIESPSKSGSS